MVGVMTVVEGGEVEKSQYRKFKINNFTKANDTGALKEMFERRIAHTDWSLPQLIVVDGSTNKKKVVESILRRNNLVIPVVAVVKDDKHNPTRLIGQKNIINLHKLSILLANAESHRFAITYHREKRRKKLKS